MKKKIEATFTFFLIIVGCNFINGTLIAQEQRLEISKLEKGKKIYYKENKRVKITTKEGEKYIGRFRIENDSIINVEGNSIYLSSIKNIKSRSVFAGIVGTSLIIYGSAVASIGAVSHIIPNDTNVDTGMLIGGAVVAATGIFFNQFAANHKHHEWSYKVTE